MYLLFALDFISAVILTFPGGWLDELEVRLTLRLGLGFGKKDSFSAATKLRGAEWSVLPAK